MFLFMLGFSIVLGLVVGSFLNAVIYRLQYGESVPKGRSFCPRCKHVLAWYDLVPLVSFIWLGARCRYCKEKISWQYPAVELATGLVFAALYTASPSVPMLVYLWAVASFLIVLFAYDLKHYILPDKILFPALGVVLGYRVFDILNFEFVSDFVFRASDFAPLANPLLAGMGAGGFFLAIFLLSRGAAMGFGDVKLAFLLGLFLGWPNIAVALFFAFCAGAVVGVALIALGKKKLKSQVPFGPFLIAGALFALLLGENLVAWYVTLVLL